MILIDTTPGPQAFQVGPYPAMTLRLQRRDPRDETEGLFTETDGVLTPAELVTSAQGKTRVGKEKWKTWVDEDYNVVVGESYVALGTCRLTGESFKLHFKVHVIGGEGWVDFWTSPVCTFVEEWQGDVHRGPQVQINFPGFAPEALDTEESMMLYEGMVEEMGHDVVDEGMGLTKSVIDAILATQGGEVDTGDDDGKPDYDMTDEGLVEAVKLVVAEGAPADQGEAPALKLALLVDDVHHADDDGGEDLWPTPLQTARIAVA